MEPNLKKFRGYLVHFYTASGIVLAFLAAKEIGEASPNLPFIFLCFFTAVLIDATDGSLARKYHVKTTAPSIDGRTIDDIVDYINYSFLPLLLIWKMDCLPEPAEFFVVPALMASLFGFSNAKAKDEKAGYFLGFPSYWNYLAFYFGLWTDYLGKWTNGAIVLFLSFLTIMPVKFLYPNLAPAAWRKSVLLGGVFWQILLAFMLFRYPELPLWVIGLSLVYPAFYTGLSLSLQGDFAKD